MSKIYSRVSSYAIAFFLCIAFSACAVTPQAPQAPQAPPTPPSSPTPSSSSEVQKKDQTTPRKEDRSRALASLRLTEQSRLLLEGGKIDDAISTLERAINVNPSNGQNYYYLAEAWLKKANFSQAREFNRLAAMYLRDEPEWIGRINDQKERIMAR